MTKREQYGGRERGPGSTEHLVGGHALRRPPAINTQFQPAIKEPRTIDILLRPAMKKSILFSLEAMLAVVVSVMLIGAIYTYTEKGYDPDYTVLDLYHLSADSIAVLKLSGGLSYSVTQNSTVNLYGLLSLMPKQSCLMLKIYDESHYHIMNAAKEGCLTVPGDPAVIYEAPFVADGKIYSVRMIAWYK